MAERENIGALAVHFTAGVAAGTLILHFSASPYFFTGGLLILLASLTSFGPNGLPSSSPPSSSSASSAP